MGVLTSTPQKATFVLQNGVFIWSVQICNACVAENSTLAAKQPMNERDCDTMVAISITMIQAVQNRVKNTFAFCNIVAAEEIRILVRYLVGEKWWHDTDPNSGLWAFEHQFVDASIESFEHPGKCFSSCEFTHKRLGLGKQGRPSYPFLPDPRDYLDTRARRLFLRIRRGIERLIYILVSF